MRKTFEFVKVGGVWFYWWPDYDGTPEELAMVGGADELLDSLDNKFVRLQMADPAAAKITLSKLRRMNVEQLTYAKVRITMTGYGFVL